MYLLDSSLIREVWLPQPDPRVLAWWNAMIDEAIAIPVPVIAELFSAIEIRPNDLAKNRLQKQVDEIVDRFSASFVPFDLAAARVYGVLFTVARRKGVPAATIDLEIASIAMLHRATIVTLEPNIYSELGIDVVNPKDGPYLL